MFFPEHLIHQGALPAIAARLMGADPYLCTAIMLVAGLPNTYPDWGSIVAAYKDRNHPNVTRESFYGISYLQRWDIHDNLHRNSRWYCFLHQWLDLYIHDGKGPWFPRLWYYWGPSWVVCFAFLFLTYC